MGLSKGFPNATTLEDLIATQANHLTKVSVSSVLRITLCPFGSTFTHHPVTLADGITSL
jgi:hypothetical protein